MGDLDSYLGIEIHRDRAKGVLTFNQASYTRKILETYGFSDKALHHTPIDSRVVYTPNTE
jgi:hypothetical protein